jgi:hypothetical protein
MDNVEDQKVTKAEELKDDDVMDGVVETGDLKRKRPEDDVGDAEGKKAKTDAAEQE